MADEKANVKDPSLLPVLEKIVDEIKTQPEWKEKTLIIKYNLGEGGYYNFYCVPVEKTETHRGLFRKHLKKNLGNPLFEVYRTGEDLFVSFGDRTLQKIIEKNFQEYASRENIKNIKLDDNLRLPNFRY